MKSRFKILAFWSNPIQWRTLCSSFGSSTPHSRLSPLAALTKLPSCLCRADRHPLISQSHAPLAGRGDRTRYRKNRRQDGERGRDGGSEGWGGTDCWSEQEWERVNRGGRKWRTSGLENSMQSFPKEGDEERKWILTKWREREWEELPSREGWGEDGQFRVRLGEAVTGKRNDSGPTEMEMKN